jgi:hypothetical protein
MNHDNTNTHRNDTKRPRGETNRGRTGVRVKSGVQAGYTLITTLPSYRTIATLPSG